MDKKIIKNQINFYLNAHVLFYAIFQIFLNGFSKTSLKIANNAIENKILKKLKHKNKKFINDYLANYMPLEKKNNKVVWLCWFQGLNNAPDIIKVCYESIVNTFKDYKVVVLTLENYSQYCKFPNYIISKLKSKKITLTHFSDILRVEVLSLYGGVWIDATVFCSSNNLPNYYLDSELFMFQCLKPGLSGHPTRISSWFISCYSNNPIINLTRALLINYWKKHNHLISYFLIHDFFEIAIEIYPNEWEKVVQSSNSNPHVLQYLLTKEYNDNQWNEIISKSVFHKLTYKNIDFSNIKKNTYLYKLMNGELR